MREESIRAKDLALSDGEHLYTQDLTTGIIKVSTGPLIVNTTGQEDPVVLENNAFNKVDLAAAKRTNPIAAQGEYIVLHNPAEDGSHPTAGVKMAVKLQMGCRVNIPGPVTFPLWPRQRAEVIKGHQLCSNEYLLLHLYDEIAAKENWDQAVINYTKKGAEGESIKLTDFDMESGKKLLVIRGTEVSYFVPPTGIKVVKSRSEGRYVRKALTLENLQYCILLDEDGTKQFRRGPDVIFPKPTERFLEDKGQKIFRPIELNPIQGIHIKVIADYQEGDKTIKAGEEIFLTGKECPIYYPRHEHSLVSYDGQQKHFATQIARGEARYLLIRDTGEIKTVKGPAMLLPNPINEVLVRRVLSQKECGDWYPGNLEAIAFNDNLRHLAKGSPTTRAGVVSEGEIERSGLSNTVNNKGKRSLTKSYVNASTNGVVADAFSRGSSYTSPRTLTFDNRFNGVPTINVWTGHAVQVVNKVGERRVEIGPANILLDYDEVLEVLHLSGGKPKTTDSLVSTPYLRVKNNYVTDIVEVETKDHVRVAMKMSYRVDFEESAKDRWFEVDNYVKLLCDHARSILKGTIKGKTIEEFYSDSTEIVREILLGIKVEGGDRKGLCFKENGMRMYDVEVLNVVIGDDKIAMLLQEQQHHAVKSAIELARERRALEVHKEQHEIAREKLTEVAETEKFKTVQLKEQITRELEVDLKKNSNAQARAAKDAELQKLRDAAAKEKLDAMLHRQTQESSVGVSIKTEHNNVAIAMLKAETQSLVDRVKAASGPITDALERSASRDTLVKVAEAMSLNNVFGQEAIDNAFVRLQGTGLEKMFEQVIDRAQLKDSKES